ncbi:terminus macrodomain insulation protein YfbV [Alteromonas facilis]|uniref:terminus macrodomain insulation protein YfbV n=1 Tax=Alteromonas facilis TaxID=2048004 RepID=UPI000C288600|nr:terminus macrodomain insulation protein YfbV [Alteromonas facilis]
MSLSVATMLKDGQSYMNTWPMEKALYAIFPECRVVALTRLLIKVAPPLAVICCAALIHQLGSGYIPQAVTIAAFFLSLPLQGIMWLGFRANQQLPPSLRAWYVDIHAKMTAQGCRLKALTPKPRYKELASMLKTAFEELDRVFTKSWF